MSVNQTWTHTPGLGTGSGCLEHYTREDSAWRKSPRPPGTVLLWAGEREGRGDKETETEVVGEEGRKWDDRHSCLQHCCFLVSPTHDIKLSGVCCLAKHHSVSQVLGKFRKQSFYEKNNLIGARTGQMIK